MSESKSFDATEFRRHGGLVFAGVIGVALSITSMGAVYHIGSLVGPLLKAFPDWKTQNITLIPFILSLGIVPMGFVVGWIADKVGVRLMLAVSQVAFGLSFIALGAFTTNLTTFYLLYFVMAITASGTLTIAYSRIVSDYFLVNRALAMGIVLSGTGVSGFILPSYTTYFVQHYDWQTAYYALGALPILVALPITLLFVRDRPRDAAAAQALPPVEGLSIADALKGYRYWVMAVAFGFASAAATPIGILLVAILKSPTHGFAAETAAALAGIYGIGIIFGRIFVGYLADRFWAPGVGAIFLLPAAIGCALLAYAGGNGPLNAFGIGLIALAAGAEFDLAAFLCARYFGLKNFGKLYAGHYVLFALGGVIAAYASGIIVDVTKSYDGVLLLSAACFIVTALMILTLGRYPKDFARAH